jgi:hypothetical protein
MQVAIINKDSERVYGIFNASSIDKALDEWAKKCGLDNYAELQRVSKDDISRDNLLILSDSAMTSNTYAKLEYVIHIFKNPIADSVFYNVYVRHGRKIDWYVVQYDSKKNCIEEITIYQDRLLSFHSADSLPVALMPAIVKDVLLKLIPDSILETSPT